MNTLIRGNDIDFDTWRTVISKMCKDDMLLNASQLVESLISPKFETLVTNN